MKRIFRHRSKPSSSREAGLARKESQKEQPFFGSSMQESFFQPAPAIQHKCENCKEEEKKVDRKTMKKGDTKTPSTPNLSFLHGKGQSLSKHQQHFFGQRMGYDFGNVKIHSGSEAMKSANEIKAQAYTYQNNIVFDEGKFQPHSSEGRQLLAHELVHVVQQKASNGRVDRKVGKMPVPEQKEILQDVTSEGKGTETQDKRAYGCAGVSAQGWTDANYDHGTYSTSAKASRSKKCEACTVDECISMSGKIASSFKASPTVTLPPIPSGLNDCEQKAVQTFINTTLAQHEQEHVNAFKTYNGEVRTPFKYVGCKADFDAYVANIHDKIDSDRISKANALSSALDPFNVPIPCDCD